MKSLGKSAFQPVFDKSIDWKAKVQRVDVKKKIVHMICHSHQDAGWLKTPDQYYNDQVKYIYTHVVEALEANPKRVFNHAEIWFFQRWWSEQSEQMKSRFRKLLASGQWVFNNGGWIASDEATPLYEDIIENIKVGHDFLQREFNLTLKVAWHADAFGHSSNTAKAFMDLGYKAFMIGRMSNGMKDTLEDT